jgi:hypothetical protein
MNLRAIFTELKDLDREIVAGLFRNLGHHTIESGSPVAAEIARPFFIVNGEIFMGTILLPRDGVATVPLTFKDSFGKPATVPPGGSVSTSDPSIITAALSADGSAVEITTVADGSATVSYVNGTMTASADVTVSDPVAASVEFGDAVISAAP